MAYNRQTYGIFFNRFWRGFTFLGFVLLNLPEFSSTSSRFLDISCIILIAFSVLVFIFSMFVRERAENYIRDGGPFDYIAEYTAAY